MEERWKSAEAIFNSLWTNLAKIVKVSPDWTVAEFGIGRWGFGRFYAQQVQKVYGIDVVDYSSAHPGVEFYLSDGKVTKIPDESVDLTVSHSVLEHVDDLDGALTEISRITRPNGYFYLTVNPLYYSSYGAHLNRGGKRLDNWEHLDPASEHYLTRNPLPGSSVGGQGLNMLTSSMFLAAVGRQPWNILRYLINFESKRIPEYVDRSKSSEMDLTLHIFNFIGQKVKKQVAPSERDSPMPMLTQSESAVKTIAPAMPASIARRRTMLLRHIAVAAHTGLELGPLDAPVISTTEAPIKYADFVTYEELLRRHSARRNASRMVRPDYILTTGSLTAQITDRFDYVIACHVIEHIPNMIAWLNDLHGLLTANGKVFLAVPDKRYTFDILRPETSLAHILNDFSRAVTVPDLEHIFEHLFLKREVSAIAAWKGDIQSLLDQQRYTLEQAYAIAQRRFETEKDIDVHCHVFTGASFLALLQQLIGAKLVPYKVVDFVEVEKPYNEFLCTLARE